MVTAKERGVPGVVGPAKSDAVCSAINCKGVQMLGQLKLPLWLGRHYLVTGGPITQAPKSMFSCRMAQEINFPASIAIPTRDFSVPDTQRLDEGLWQVVNQLIKGKPVYVGCMAGRGRTGLMLAVLAKAFGVSRPVEYVREHYYPHAVETREQYEFVENYQVPPMVISMIMKAKLRSIFRRGKLLTNA